MSAGFGAPGSNYVDTGERGDDIIPANRKHREGAIVTIKEMAIKTLEQLPEDATWEDVQERINFVAGIRKGLRELDEGRGIAHERVKEEFAEWLSS